MKVTFALLSPTFGMHQYTAHLVARSAADLGASANVITTRNAPGDRYTAASEVMTPLETHGTGFAPEGLAAAGYRRTREALHQVACDETVHFTGVHLWNLPLAKGLIKRGIRVVHSLHDLSPHSSVRRGTLIRLWNRLLIGSGSALLVHGERYRQELLRRGVAEDKIYVSPLTHGFWGWSAEGEAQALEAELQRWLRRRPFALFFGRIEKYKGVHTLLEAWERLNRLDRATGGARLVIAGQLGHGVRLPALPNRTELRDRRIGDAEGLALFREAALLVLPYRDATQSALIAAAARFSAPSLVTRTGALPEYVCDGVTGWVIPPEDPLALAEKLREALGDAAALARAGEAARAWYEQARARELETLADAYVSGQPRKQGGIESAPVLT